MNERRVRHGVVGVLLAVWAVQAVVAAANPRGDFLLHHEFGRRLRAGEFLYRDGMHAPYPPAWAVPHAPLSLLPPAAAKPLVHLAGAAALLLLLRVLNDLSKAALPLLAGRGLWVAAAALAAGSFFLLRDFDDGGQNVILLALVWAGVWSAANGRPVLGGAGVGLTVALKCTAGIFVLYFLLKRQWRLAAASLAWAGLFSLSPVLWQGPAEFRHAAGCWADTVARGLSERNPSAGVLGPEKLQNWCLRNSLARYLVHLPPGHPGRAYTDDRPDGDPARAPNPASVDLLDLPPETAGWVIKAVTVLGLLAAGWLMRGRLAADGIDRARYLWELAAVGVLGLLLSPITWGQHCVAAVPALYLMARAVAAGVAARWVRGFLIGFAVFFLLASRLVLGKTLGLLVESYHPHTAALVGLVVALFASRPGRAAGSAVVGAPAPEVRPRAAA